MEMISPLPGRDEPSRNNSERSGGIPQRWLVFAIVQQQWTAEDLVEGLAMVTAKFALFAAVYAMDKQKLRSEKSIARVVSVWGCM